MRGWADSLPAEAPAPDPYVNQPTPEPGQPKPPAGAAVPRPVAVGRRMAGSGGLELQLLSATSYLALRLLGATSG